VRTVRKAPLVIVLHGYDNAKEDHAFQAMHLASWGMHSLALNLPKRGPWIANGRTLAALVDAIHINLGEMYTNGTGVRQDFVRAHMWFTLAAAGLSGDSGDTATKNREGIASKMTAEQIATAQEMARRCQESKLKNCE
jgi:hypothetical protein